MTEEMTIHEAADVFSSLLDDNGNIKEEEPNEQPKEQPEEAEGEAQEEAQEEAAEKTEEEEKKEDEEQPKEEPKKYTVKVDGQELEVDEGELVQGYQRQADYTRKTQELARERNEVAQMIPNAVKQATAQYEQAIESLVALVGQEANKYTPDEMKRLLDEDPIQYMKVQQEQQERQRVLSLHAAQQKAAKEAEAIAIYQRESQALLEKLPEWKDDKIASAEKAELGQSLLSSGFTQEEVANLLDHRSVLIARKAMLYDKLMQAKTSVKEKLDKTPVKVEKAGSRTALQASPRKGLEQKLAKTGKIEDAAALFSSYI